MNPNPVMTVTGDALIAYREDIAAAEARRAHRHRMARMDYNRAMNAIEGEYDAERRTASQRYEAQLRAAGLEADPVPEYRATPLAAWQRRSRRYAPATRNGRKSAIGSGTADPASRLNPPRGRAA